MAEIGQRLFSVDGTRPFLRLYREEFVRPISIDPLYPRPLNIRLSLLFSIADTGGNLAASDYGFFGLCNGTQYPYSSGGSCVRALGFNTYNWIYTAGATANYRNSSWRAVHRINGVDSTNTTGSFDPYIPATSGSARRGIMVIDIATQGSTMTGYVQNATVVLSDTTMFNFLEMAETNMTQINFGTTNLTGYTRTAGGSSTASLNAINIFWNNGNAPLEIYAMSVCAFDI